MKADHPELSAFQRDALAVIAKLGRRATDSYGLAIKRELQDLYGATINHGRLYPNLNELVEMGLVEKRPLDKRTNEYRLTDAGREEMHSYARRLVYNLGLEAKDLIDEPVVMTDGGADQCVECGAWLPDELVEDAGVYCPHCGTGQHAGGGR